MLCIHIDIINFVRMMRMQCADRVGSWWVTLICMPGGVYVGFLFTLFIQKSNPIWQILLMVTWGWHHMKTPSRTLLSRSDNYRLLYISISIFPLTSWGNHLVAMLNGKWSLVYTFPVYACAKGQRCLWRVKLSRRLHLLLGGQHHAHE